MLAAAGMSVTWMYRKVRILTIFDDLDTILLLVPLKMLMIGLAWPVAGNAIVAVGVLWRGWQYLHRWLILTSWPWVLGYSIVIGLTCELLFFSSKVFCDVPIHIEVLLPAFVLGALMKQPVGSDPHANDAREGHQEGPTSTVEQRVSTIITATFMLLVGLNMPHMTGEAPAAAVNSMPATISAGQPLPSWPMIGIHVAVLTVVINLGKMVPLLCYRREAHWKERLAVSVALFPRGEVGAGVLVVSISFGIGGPIVTVGLMCIALNLLLTGLFIVAVKQLTRKCVASSPQAEGIKLAVR
jgi:hypothetical protein